PYTPSGHATCTSITYNIKRNCVVFFKDSWWVACDGVMNEGEVYTILSKVHVPSIPHCSASGDIGDENYHSTCTNQFANMPWAVKCTHKFTPHWHHQEILDNIGERLETFQCSKDMVYAIQAALAAHEAAYWNCRILHHSISPNNILLMKCPKFRGELLIDWD
ncbi:hypothetical protein EI94DRAFT_1468480, partial [Lactarius quietus]